MAYKVLPFEENFTLHSGSTKIIYLRYSFKDGDPVDLSDWDAYLAFGPTYATPIGEMSVDNGGIVLDNEGFIQITFTGVYIRALAANPDIPVKRYTGTLFYNLTLVDPALGEPLGAKIFMLGKLFIEQSVPRAV